VKRPGAQLRFEATGRWEMGDDKLPTRRTPSAGLDADCAVLDVDHCYDGWRGTVQLTDAMLHTRVRAGLERLVVFTNGTRDFVAIEPVSHVNNAVNLAASGADAAALGLRTLLPGESMTVQMSIETERAA
jgi:aldose 1-epimerase